MGNVDAVRPLRVAVVGAGSFGTALSSVLAKNGMRVSLIARRRELVEEINARHTNTRYLPGVQLHAGVYATDAHSIAADADVVLLAAPSHAMRETCAAIAPHIKAGAIVAHAAKGLETDTQLRMSEVIREAMPSLDVRKLAVISGPSHAEEVSRELPTTLVVASASRLTAQFVQDLLMNRTLRVYTNPDVLGVELGGALKNIIALGCGISDGLSYGDNARAALMTRGLVEISRLGLKMGAAFSTFSGLAGVGDLIVTSTSRHSRNWNTGYLLGQGVPLEEALQRVGMVVEGVRTTKAAVALAQKHQVQMPIAAAIYSILFAGKSPRAAVEELMGRTKTHEMEEVIQDATASWEYA